MQKIIIDNFCAIDHIELDLDNKIDVIIGAQASGKSTIAKTVYFCRKTRDYLMEYLVEPSNFKSVHPNEYYSYFLKSIRQRFMGCFGTTKHMMQFTINFFYDVDSNSYMTLRLDQSGYVRVYFSKNILNKIKSLIKESAKLFVAQDDKKSDMIFENLINDFNYRKIVRMHFVETLNELFNYSKEIIYIPAGRSILATLSEQLPNLDSTVLDLPLKEFLDLINSTKKRFGYTLNDIVSNYTKTVDGQINNDSVNIAYSLINSILKGDYINESDGEKIYYKKDKWVKLKYASSGQQEILWILLVIFIRIMENKSVFMVIEEPEAHLFPSAQKNVLELISLLINSNDSQVLITTHSPYVLTSINLLAYSGKIENKRPTNKTNSVINRKFRINPNELSAYMLTAQEKFEYQSIIDNDERVIDAAKIDQISSEINELTLKLLNMEISNGMQ